MTHVVLNGLTKTYPGATAPAIDQLSLEVASGELLALLGPSGCGKTTTMKIIAGLEEPTGGDILCDGRSILRDRPEDRGVVMVFQNNLLFPTMSVAENISFGLRMRHVSAPEITSRVAEMLKLVHLPDLGRRKPSELSGGQQQRVALARALIVRPKVLLLDEPLSSLDAHLRLEMRDLIRSVQKRLGITTIFVTHEQEEAVVLADRIALILEGRLRQHAVPDQFYSRPADVAVARFFGGRNFVPGRAEGGLFHSSVGPLRLPDGAPEGQGMLTIRPESLRLGAAPENCLPARLAERTFLGTQTRLRLQLGDVVLEMVQPPDQVQNLQVGDHLTVTLPRSSLWVLK